MNRFGWILLLLTASPALLSADAKKLTVGQLQDMLTGLHSAKKSDEQVANQLQQIELTEELTTAAMNGMANLIPGPLSTEQMYVLEARSSMLAPPDTDLPKASAPDDAAQQAMLANAQNYASKTYAQLPHLTASRMTARFQDGTVAAPTYSSVQGGITDDRDPILNEAKASVRLMNTRTDTIESDRGNEKLVVDKTPWGPNGEAASVGPPLAFNTAIHEIASNGNPKWLRWQSINGKQVAVYSFTVERKKTRFSIVYCCFPETDVSGTTHLSTPQGSTLTSSGGGGATGPPGNMQNSVQWSNFKANSGYHGELFVDPGTGTVVRLITEADFKPGDFVHNDAIRTDFAPMTISGKTLIVPIRSFNVAEIVPNGEANASRFVLRHQFVTRDYKDYRLDGATGAFNARDDAKPRIIDSSSNKLVKEINADVLAARAANKEKRYADAEAIASRDTASNPDLIPPWIELGLAQMGLKKYAEAETTFKTALAINPKAPKSQRDIGFQEADAPQTTRVSRHVTTGSAIASDQARSPEIIGISDSSLGEIYIRTHRIPEAEEAFDAAARANPAQAAFYLRNETIFFFQLGNSDAQLRAAEKAIAADPHDSAPYYFKGVALVSKATIDQSGKMVLPPECTDAYQKYLELDPHGQFAGDAANILASAGLPAKASK